MNTANKASLLSTLIALATGVILCIAYRIPDSTRMIIYVAGASFLIASLVNIVLLCDTHDREGRRRRSVFSSVIGWIVSVAGAALGLTMLVTPATFVASLVYLFGIILLLAGLYYFVVYGRGMPGYSFAAWTYLLPLLVVADGLVMLLVSRLREADYQHYVVLMMGIGLIVAAVANAVVYIEVARYNRTLRRGQAAMVASQSHHAPVRDEGDEVEPSI